MQKVEIKPSAKIILVLNGNEYPLTKPKMGMALEFEEKLESAKESGKGSLKIMIEFLTQCGLPKDIVQELDSDELEQVLKALVPTKKE